MRNNNKCPPPIDCSAFAVSAPAGRPVDAACVWPAGRAHGKYLHAAAPAAAAVHLGRRPLGSPPPPLVAIFAHRMQQVGRPTAREPWPKEECSPFGIYLGALCQRVQATLRAQCQSQPPLPLWPTAATCSNLLGHLLLASCSSAAAAAAAAAAKRLQSGRERERERERKRGKKRADAVQIKQFSALIHSQRPGEASAQGISSSARSLCGCPSERLAAAIRSWNCCPAAPAATCKRAPVSGAFHGRPEAVRHSTRALAAAAAAAGLCLCGSQSVARELRPSRSASGRENCSPTGCSGGGGGGGLRVVGEKKRQRRGKKWPLWPAGRLASVSLKFNLHAKLISPLLAAATCCCCRRSESAPREQLAAQEVATQRASSLVATLKPPTARAWPVLWKFSLVFHRQVAGRRGHR